MNAFFKIHSKKVKSKKLKEKITIKQLKQNQNQKEEIYF
jgi:hypothetical protein